MDNYHFGYKKQHDDRNMRYLMSQELAAFPEGQPPGSRYYRPGAILDQGRTGTCVAHGGTSMVEAGPVMQSTAMHPYDLYRKVVLNDIWSDNDYEATAHDSQLQNGTSSLALMKTLQQLGFIKTYLWATGAEDVRNWILSSKGPVGLGVWWKTAMLETDTTGFISYTGYKEGGHFVMIGGYNDFARRGRLRVRAFRIQNSWGESWGDGGRCWISYEDLDAAIRDDGEACAPTEIRRVKTP